MIDRDSRIAVGKRLGTRRRCRLTELGYFKKRQARWEGARPGEMRQFITPAGRDLLDVLGIGENG